MVDDLLASKTIMGRSLSQLEEMLGEPDLVRETEDVKLLFYMLGDQRMHPSSSIWFPRLFPNNDRWFLEIRLDQGKARAAKVFFT